MTRSPILFRCDGDPQIGWEALYVCLTYAAALQRRRRPTYFLSRVEPNSLLGLVHRGGSDWVAADHQVGSDDDLIDVAREVRRLGAGAVVVAGDGVRPDYLAEVRALGVTVIALTMSAEKPIDADLIINPLLAPTEFGFTPGAQVLAGRRYVMARPIFRRQRPVRSQEPPAPPFRGLVAFGDDDLLDQTAARVEHLLETSRVDKLTAVIRAHHPRFEQLQGLAESHPGRFEVVTEPNEIGHRLPRAHFAVTSGDTLTLEFACVGLPQIIITQRGRHVPTAQALEEAGAGTYLGHGEQVTADQLCTAVGGLMADPLERLAMSRCARMMIDGRGPDRIVHGTEVMLHVPMIRQQRMAA